MGAGGVIGNKQLWMTRLDDHRFGVQSLNADAHILTFQRMRVGYNIGRSRKILRQHQFVTGKLVSQYHLLTFQRMRVRNNIGRSRKISRQHQFVTEQDFLCQTTLVVATKDGFIEACGENLVSKGFRSTKPRSGLSEVEELKAKLESKGKVVAILRSYVGRC
ncbi:hypothetical protein V6N12_065549 [Hibiscus sabdariffa]|uniref:Uncharacterized protein n=1 Tax=Hibiscus sabdariffa TaxID=183260 RepID=A0ABR2G987_9ROSI